jgi:hypothetical protein
MRFAHLKVQHGVERMRLRGLIGARDEFHLAAIVQNLKRWRCGSSARQRQTFCHHYPPSLGALSRRVEHRHVRRAWLGQI